MKRIMMIMLAFGMCMSITACGGSESTSAQEAKTETATEETTEKAVEEATTEEETIKKETTKISSSSKKEEEFYCMGKNDTCTNKTSSAWDLYCYSCDPDDNNIEGDQSDGEIGDNNYDGYVDEEDWEIEWNEYLNDKLADY